MNYLSPSEYSNFGLDAATNEAFVTAASRLIDAHCRRATLAPQAYTERHRLASGRNTLLLTHLPVLSLTSARGRFAKPRRDESQSNDLVIAISGAFGLPGTWTDLDVANFDLDPRTGEVSTPAHPLGLAYNEVEITYQALLALARRLTTELCRETHPEERSDEGALCMPLRVVSIGLPRCARDVVSKHDPCTWKSL